MKLLLLESSRVDLYIDINYYHYQQHIITAFQKNTNMNKGFEAGLIHALLAMTKAGILFFETDKTLKQDCLVIK